jgi:hypothetical protein
MEGYLGASAPSYPWVTKWLRGLGRGENIFELNELLGRPDDPLTSLKVIKFLNSNLVASVRRIITATKIPRSTVFNHLMVRGYTIRDSKWILHDLTAAIMEQQIQPSKNCSSW